MSCSVGYRRDSDPTLPWLWGRSAAVVLIQPLAWEPPCAVGVALKRQKKNYHLLSDNLKFLSNILLS